MALPILPPPVRPSGLPSKPPRPYRIHSNVARPLPRHAPTAAWGVFSRSLHAARGGVPALSCPPALHRLRPLARPSIRQRRCTGGRRGGRGVCRHCVLLPSPLLPFTVCVLSLSGVLRWAGVVLGGLRLLCCLLCTGLSGVFSAKRDSDESRAVRYAKVFEVDYLRRFRRFLPKNSEIIQESSRIFLSHSEGDYLRRKRKIIYEDSGDSFQKNSEIIPII